MKILCTIPIRHLPEVKLRLENMGEVDYMVDVSYVDLHSALQGGGYDVVYLSPNKMKFKFDRHLIDAPSSLKAIATVSTGIDHIDTKYCKSKNVDVISLSGDECLNLISSTAEHAFGLMLALIRYIPSSFESVMEGYWNYEPFVSHQLRGLTAGIIGYGRLGKMFASYCKAFGMEIRIYDPLKFPHGNLRELFDKCDVISIHANLTEETRGMIDHSVLRHGTDVCLINTARGQIVCEDDVITALKGRHLAGYATDVLSNEHENLRSSPIINAAKCLNIIITPHVGGTTCEAQSISYMRIAQILEEKMNEISAG